LLRAAQEGIAFSFKYGVDIMKEMGLNISVIRAGKANMFLSNIFRETLADITGASIELYNTDGAQGAARGAAYGAGLYKSFEETFKSLNKVGEVHPNKNNSSQALEVYEKWLNQLNKIL
jgi:xylulokinase